MIPAGPSLVCSKKEKELKELFENLRFILVFLCFHVLFVYGVIL